MSKEESPRHEAAKRGDRFYEGRECSTCGATTRYVLTRACVFCTKEKSKAERIRVREWVRKAQELKQGAKV